MIKDWLTWITYGIGGLATLFFCIALWYMWSRPAMIPPIKAIPEKTTLPERAFKQSQERYDAIGEPVLSLKETPATLQIPDLRNQLTYYGKNSRPDAQEELTTLNFGLTNGKSSASIPPGDKLFLTYDRSQKPSRFVFSPENEQTSLWIDASPQGNEAVINVSMVNEKGEVIKTPTQNAQFRLKEKDQTRSGKTWELGKWRVDATLLSRQKARWFGQDKFLERHGGDEYAYTIGKERIDFTEGDTPYSVHLGENNVLIWVDDQWKEATPGPETTKFPLLVVKKISDRVMNLELWNVDGKGKINLNLLKSADIKTPPGIQKNFKFIGAKTRSQFIFEVNKNRVILKPKDWLILTKEGWKKLSTPQDIDDYVNRKLVGPLFVFDGVSRKKEGQAIEGTLFNPSRTEMSTVELPVQQARANTPPPKEEREEVERRAPPRMYDDEPLERPTREEIQRRRELMQQRSEMR